MAETHSKAQNTSVAGLAEAGVLESTRGKVRLFRPTELPGARDPAADVRLTNRASVHHLIRVLEAGGESAAAALSHNALVPSWPEIGRLAREDGRTGAEQGGLFG